MHAKINPTMVEVIIRTLHISLIKQNRLFVVSYVDPTRKAKAEKFVNENDQLLSLGAGYLLKKHLPKGEIKLNTNGKPFLTNGPFFNISHSGEYVIFASHPTRDVGIDIEKVDENKLDGIRYVLDQEEKKENDINTLFQIWSNKESIIKCLSSSLKDIRNIKGLPLEGIRNIDGEDYYTKSAVYDGYSLSVTLKGREPFDIRIETINSLEER